MFEIEKFFHAVIVQDECRLRSFFHPEAWVEWPCTNEHFTVEEYIRANCEYPGNWSGRIEKCEGTVDGCIIAAKVWPKNESASFHAVSFIRLLNDRIISMVEYWADDGSAPEWRSQKQIGRPIDC